MARGTEKEQCRKCFRECDREALTRREMRDVSASVRRMAGSCEASIQVIKNMHLTTVQCTAFYL